MLLGNMGHNPQKVKGEKSLDFPALIRLPLPYPHSCISEDACAQERAKVLFRCIPLTHGYMALVDAQDYPGAATVMWHASKANKYASLFYACRNSPRTESGHRGKNIWLHRVIANPPPDMVADHINGDSIDCRRQNLRVCTKRQNLQNKHRRTPRKSGITYKGVYLLKGRIFAAAGGARIGTFTSLTEAARAYDRAALALFGEFANLNFPNEHKNGAPVQPASMTGSASPSTPSHEA